MPNAFVMRPFYTDPEKPAESEAARGDVITDMDADRFKTLEARGLVRTATAAEVKAAAKAPPAPPAPPVA